MGFMNNLNLTYNAFLPLTVIRLAPCSRTLDLDDDEPTSLPE